MRPQTGIDEMDLSPSAQRGISERSRRARVEDLLKKYPHVDAAEDAEILRFLKKGPPLDVGLMTTNEEVRDKLDAFRSEHASHFRLGLREYLLVAVLLAAFVAACVLLSDSGLR